MRAFRKTVLTGVVWFSASMMLVAGTPHFECRCPNGQFKLFCLGCACMKGSVNAGGTCGARSPGESTSRSTAPKCCSLCCGHNSQRHSSSSSCGHQATRAGCIRAMAQLANFTITPDTKAPSPDLGFGISSVPATVVATISPNDAGDHHSLRCPGLAPPRDLVMVLQHFLI